jgi:hypothetical protein
MERWIRIKTEANVNIILKHFAEPRLGWRKPINYSTAMGAWRRRAAVEAHGDDEESESDCRSMWLTFHIEKGRKNLEMHHVQ